MVQKVCLVLDAELYKELKVYAVMNNKTISEVVAEAVRKEIRTVKE